MSSTREAVAELLDQGIGRLEIARRLGVSKSTVSYHARRLGQDIDERCRRRYDWNEVQAYYDEGHSITACQKRFGCARKSLMDAAARGAFRTRPPAKPIEQLLSENRNRAHLRVRLIAAGLKPAACEVCGIDDWLGAPLSLQLHHRNGIGDDNRLENLQVLCPNCHAQTDSWGGRNRGRAAAQSDSSTIPLCGPTPGSSNSPETTTNPRRS